MSTRVWARIAPVTDALARQLALTAGVAVIGTSVVAGVGAVLAVLLVSGMGSIAAPCSESRLQTQQSD